MTMRLCFLLAFACVGAACADPPRQLIETGDSRHVAVIGDGYLLATDAEEKRYLVRSCVLALDVDNRLACRLRGELLRFDPPIDVPHDALKLLITPTGDVSELERGLNDNLIRIGMLEMSLPSGCTELRETAPGIFACDGELIPIVSRFGDDSRAYLLQGWIDADVLRAERKRVKRHRGE